MIKNVFLIFVAVFACYCMLVLGNSVAYNVWAGSFAEGEIKDRRIWRAALCGSLFVFCLASLLVSVGMLWRSLQGTGAKTKIPQSHSEVEREKP